MKSGIEHHIYFMVWNVLDFQFLDWGSLGYNLPHAQHLFLILHCLMEVFSSKSTNQWKHYLGNDNHGLRETKCVLPYSDFVFFFHFYSNVIDQRRDMVGLNKFQQEVKSYSKVHNKWNQW